MTDLIGACPCTEIRAMCTFRGRLSAVVHCPRCAPQALHVYDIESGTLKHSLPCEPIGSRDRVCGTSAGTVWIQKLRWVRCILLETGEVLVTITSPTEDIITFDVDTTGVFCVHGDVYSVNYLTFQAHGDPPDLGPKLWMKHLCAMVVSVGSVRNGRHVVVTTKTSWLWVDWIDQTIVRSVPLSGWYLKGSGITTYIAQTRTEEGWCWGNASDLMLGPDSQFYLVRKTRVRKVPLPVTLRLLWIRACCAAG